MKLIFLIFGIILLLFVVLWFNKKSENFDQSSKLILQTIDLGDHTTIAKIYPGKLSSILVMIPGSPYQNQWDPVISELLNSGKDLPTLITYDPRGFGSANNIIIDPKFSDSNPFNTAWNIDNYVTDFWKIIDALGITTKISIAAWGFGGLIAQKAGLARPDKINELFLLQGYVSALTIESTNVIDSLATYLNKYAEIQYLPMPQEIKQQRICQIFDLNKQICPGNNDPTDQSKNTAFINAVSNLNDSSARAFQQVLKIANTVDPKKWWTDFKDPIPFRVFILSADRDVRSKPDDNTILEQAIEDHSFSSSVIKNGNKPIALKIVPGKHYTTFSDPQMTSNILLERINFM
jgi:pimeloyl-ACP methyl ester carboxylesterase